MFVLNWSRERFIWNKETTIIKPCFFHELSARAKNGTGDIWIETVIPTSISYDLNMEYGFKDVSLKVSIFECKK